MAEVPSADAVDSSLTAVEIGWLAVGAALTLLGAALVTWWTLTERPRDDAPEAHPEAASSDSPDSHSRNRIDS